MSWVRAMFGLVSVAVLSACTAGEGLEVVDDELALYEGQPTAGASSGAGGTGGGNGAPVKAASAVVCDGKPQQEGDKPISVTIGKTKRTAQLHVPKGYDPKKGASLVLAFHGYGSTASGMRSQTNLDDEADKRGVIVAYVQGIGIASNGFNGGDCCGQPAWIQPADDVKLAREIVKSVSEEFCVDPKRVYSAGFSNGGFMSYRIGCEAADMFAAVASIAGVLGVAPDKCTPSRPVPIFHAHGTSDPVVPFKGGGAVSGLGEAVGINFRSVEETLSTFRSKYSCASTPKPTESKGDSKCERWDGCADGAAVELCTIESGGHQWPGGASTNPLAGKTSKDLNATARLLDFFADHAMP